MATAARVKRRYPLMIVMVRLLDTLVTVEITRQVFGGLPEIFHTDTGTADIWRIVARDQVGRLHAQGLKVYVNALPVERRWWYHSSPSSATRRGEDGRVSSKRQRLTKENCSTNILSPK